MDFKEMGDEIVDTVGGKDNVISLSHCVTRLRFVLKDESKVDRKKTENISGVLGTAFGAGQYQVIIGNTVGDAFDAIQSKYHFGGEQTENNAVEKKEKLTWRGAGMAVVNYMSGSVSPVITGLVAGGMLKLVLYILTLISPDIAAFSSYQLISILANIPFYFMPMFVAYGASQKLGIAPVMPLIIAAALIAPDFTALEGPVSLFGLNVPLYSYSSTAIPAMLSTLAVYWMQKLFNKIVPSAVKNLMVDPLTLVTAFFLTFTILAPLGTVIGNGVVNGLVALENVAGPLALAVFTAILPFMIMAGVHTLVAPFMLENLNTLGYDNLFRPGLLLQLLAEGGAAFGIAASVSSKKKRSESISIGIEAIFAGVTEPAIFGLNMKYKGALYGAIAGGLAGGLVGGVLGVRSYVLTKNTILALPVFEDTMVQMAAACAVTFIVSFAVTYTINRKSEKKEDSVSKSGTIILPAKGKTMQLEQVNDPTFSKKLMGDGIAVEPDDGTIVSPFEGIVTVAFPTGHAYGITRADGVEALVHIGIDTVNLNGKEFKALVKQGDKVAAGQPLAHADLDLIKKEGYDPVTMLVFTNLNGNTLIHKDDGVRIENEEDKEGKQS